MMLNPDKQREILEYLGQDYGEWFQVKPEMFDAEEKELKETLLFLDDQGFIENKTDDWGNVHHSKLLMDGQECIKPDSSLRKKIQKEEILNVLYTILNQLPTEKRSSLEEIIENVKRAADVASIAMYLVPLFFK